MIRIIAIEEKTSFHSLAARRYSGMKVMIAAPISGPARLKRIPPTTTYIITFTEEEKLASEGVAS